MGCCNRLSGNDLYADDAYTPEAFEADILRLKAGLIELSAYLCFCSILAGVRG